MILLIRHGEADHHVKELTGGWTDSALTVRGQQQFQQLADCLAGDFPAGACPGSFPAISGGPGPGPRSSPKTGDGPGGMFFLSAGKEQRKSRRTEQKRSPGLLPSPVTGRELDHVNYDGERPGGPSTKGPSGASGNWRNRTGI